MSITKHPGLRVAEARLDLLRRRGRTAATESECVLDALLLAIAAAVNPAPGSSKSLTKSQVGTLVVDAFHTGHAMAEHAGVAHAAAVCRCGHAWAEHLTGRGCLECGPCMAAPRAAEPSEASTQAADFATQLRALADVVEARPMPPHSDRGLTLALERVPADAAAYYATGLLSALEEIGVRAALTTGIGTVGVRATWEHTHIYAELAYPEQPKPVALPGPRRSADSVHSDEPVTVHSAASRYDGCDGTTVAPDEDGGFSVRIEGVEGLIHFERGELAPRQLAVVAGGVAS